ncbi:MAG: hypothetical protein HQ453_09210 [Actinobacteria bacterium]|nr:hypothetical protein [Actinomycetota bacterium]
MSAHVHTAARIIAESLPLTRFDDEVELLPLIVRKARDGHPHSPVVPEGVVTDFEVCANARIVGHRRLRIVAS